MEKVSVGFRTGPDPSKLKRMLEEGGEWDLVAVDPLEKEA